MNNRYFLHWILWVPGDLFVVLATTVSKGLEGPEFYKASIHPDIMVQMGNNNDQCQLQQNGSNKAFSRHICIYVLQDLYLYVLHKLSISLFNDPGLADYRFINASDTGVLQCFYRCLITIAPLCRHGKILKRNDQFKN